MANVEVRTRMVVRGPMARGGPVLILEILLTPRGSGNRKLAVALARAAKSHAKLGRHVKKVRAGYSKVWITLTPSVALARTMLEWNADREKTPDVPGQLPLFGGPVPA